MHRLHGEDLDVGQSEPAGSLDAGNLKTLPGQHGLQLGGREGVAATTRHGSPWSPAWTAGEDVGEHHRPARVEHPGDLCDPGRQVRPVAQRQGGEHQVEPVVGEGQALGSTLDVPDRQPGGSGRDGGRHHPSGQIDADQVGRRIAPSSRAKQPAGATANIQNPARPGQQPATKLQGRLLYGDEQELLQHAVLVGARPKVEPTPGRTSVAHVSALVVGGPVGG